MSDRQHRPPGLGRSGWPVPPSLLRCGRSVPTRTWGAACLVRHHPVGVTWSCGVSPSGSLSPCPAPLSDHGSAPSPLSAAPPALVVDSPGPELSPRGPYRCAGFCGVFLGKSHLAWERRLLLDWPARPVVRAPAHTPKGCRLHPGPGRQPIQASPSHPCLSLALSPLHSPQTSGKTSSWGLTR